MLWINVVFYRHYMLWYSICNQWMKCLKYLINFPGDIMGCIKRISLYSCKHKYTHISSFIGRQPLYIAVHFTGVYGERILICRLLSEESGKGLEELILGSCKYFPRFVTRRSGGEEYKIRYATVPERNINKDLLRT